MIEKLSSFFNCSNSKRLGKENIDAFTSLEETLQFILKQDMIAKMRK